MLQRRAVVEVASTPFVSLKTITSVRFAIPIETEKTDEEMVEEIMKRVEQMMPLRFVCWLIHINME
jgi:ribosome maturation protein Sdo1